MEPEDKPENPPPNGGELTIPDMAPPAPPIDWEALGLRNSDMERFAQFVKGNLQTALDAAQGTTFTIMASLNTRLRLIENQLNSPNLDQKERARLELRYQSIADLALKAANQVTTSGYTRIKALAKAVDADDKMSRKKKPGFVKRVAPAK